jgi:HSP20 family molecular chaperone IbpA
MKSETVDVYLKLDSQRYGWNLDEVQPAGTAANRRRPALRTHAWRPPTDVYETEDQVVVRVEIAGVSEDGFSISLTGRFLSIRGVRSDIPERRAYHQMEIFFGEFLTEIELPSAVSTEAVKAEYRYY